jgi:hypothetical protein
LIISDGTGNPACSRIGKFENSLILRIACCKTATFSAELQKDLITIAAFIF